MPDGHTAVRVRFAPNGEVPFAAFFARTILYSWLFAKRYRGTFILRFDDSDLDHQIPGALQSYADGMRWLGLGWDEGPDVGGSAGPYWQSERLQLFRDAVLRLLSSGWAYRCYCDEARLKKLAADARLAGSRQGPYDGRCRTLTAEEVARFEGEGRRPAIRLRTPDAGPITTSDLLRGDITVDASQLSDFVICRPDGWPTYHLTVTVDDAAMGISHVLRGVEGLSNMAPQALVHRALGLPPPLYLHFPLVRTTGYEIGDRFFPRGHLIYLDELIEAGYSPLVIVNYFASLGYTNSGDELKTLDRLAAEFDYRRISHRDFVVQSQEKLAWSQRRYLKETAPDEEIETLIVRALGADGVPGDAAQAIAARAARILRPRLAAGQDPAELLRFAHRISPALAVSAAPRRIIEAAVGQLRRGGSLADLIRDRGRDRPSRRTVSVALLAALNVPDTVLSPDDVVEILTREVALARLERGL